MSSFGAAILTAASYFLQLEVATNLDRAQRAFQEEQNLQGNQAEYDFIIVGGGTAGCLLTNRLSKHYRVLLLEGGGPAPLMAEVPLFRGLIGDEIDLNYFYTSVPQKHAGNRKLERVTGRMLGGSFAHNALYFNRGNSHDYDQWARLTKDSSWKYQNLLPIFKSLETYQGEFGGDQRGTRGPIPVRMSKSEEVNLFKKAAAELGYGFGDANGPQKEGFAPLDISKTKTRAVTSCSLLVTPLIGVRKNLDVLTYTDASKVLFDTNAKAIGVAYVRFNRSFTAYAKKEVIVSAGTFGTSILLFKSGIGPKKMLKSAKIHVIADLPVGKSLVDHLVLPIFVSRTPPYKSVPQTLTPEDFETYLKGKADGILSEIESTAQAYFVSAIAKSKGESTWPDLNFIWEGKTDTKTTEVTSGLVRPKSVGSVKLNIPAYLRGERRNKELAVIDYNILSHKDDLPRMIEAIKKVVAIFETKAMRHPYVYTVQPPATSCGEPDKGSSNGYWKCVIVNLITTQYHPVGTCKMGFGSNDKSSVVDSSFRVRGLGGLRIVDASVMPRITNANTNAPTLLLAEKAARIILHTTTK